MKLDANKIYLLCAKRNLSQSELAEKAKAGTDFMARVKRGCNVKSKTLGKLAAALNCEPEELILKED